MKHTHNKVENNQCTKKQFIGFCAFIAGFLLSSMVYSEPQIIDEKRTEEGVVEPSLDLILEETLIRLDQAPPEEPRQDFNEDGDDEFIKSTPKLWHAELLWGVDFTAGHHPVTIEIYAEENRRNIDLPIKISFLPDEHCEFGEGRACIYPFSTSPSNQILLASVHSGVGAAAEAFRHYLEGTGFNQGQYNLSQVTKHADSLEGSAVQLLQGAQKVTGLEVISVLRIPPESLDAYMALPVEEIIPFAIQVTGIDPDVFDQSLLIFETCGWQLPDEDPVEGHTVTSSSVYLGIIGESD